MRQMDPLHGARTRDDPERHEPQGSETITLSSDRSSREKARDIGGLHLWPKDRARVLKVGAQSPWGAAVPGTRPDAALPFAPGPWNTHDPVRHGTTILFAALDMKSGKVIGERPPPSLRPPIRRDAARHKRGGREPLARADLAAAPPIHRALDGREAAQLPVLRAHRRARAQGSAPSRGGEEQEEEPFHGASR